MKTLADLKEELKIGTKVMLKTRFGQKVNKIREVVATQSNGLTFKTEEGKKSFFEYPKASLLEMTTIGFKIYSWGLRDLTPTEKAIKQGYEKIRNREQERMDLLTDGSSSYWQEKRYYQQHNAEYLMGCMKQRGMMYDFNSKKVKDDKVKGQMILEYQFI